MFFLAMTFVGVVLHQSPSIKSPAVEPFYETGSGLGRMVSLDFMDFFCF